MTAHPGLKRTLVVAVLLIGSLVTLEIATGPNDPPGSRVGRPAATSYSHDELQRAADMAQRMSAPNANSDHPVHRDDEQLRRSRDDPGYVDALEWHQADIDRMLAQGRP
jgi:hypothetical protein